MLESRSNRVFACNRVYRITNSRRNRHLHSTIITRLNLPLKKIGSFLHDSTIWFTDSIISFIFKTRCIWFLIIVYNSRWWSYLFVEDRPAFLLAFPCSVSCLVQTLTRWSSNTSCYSPSSLQVPPCRQMCPQSSSTLVSNYSSFFNDLEERSS